MKQLFFCVIILIGLSAFSVIGKEKYYASPNRVQGLYVYVDAEPVGDYKSLGIVKKTVGLSGQYTSVRDGLIKKAVKDYPEADAIIISFNSLGSDKAEVIKFD